MVETHAKLYKDTVIQTWARLLDSPERVLIWSLLSGDWSCMDLELGHEIFSSNLLH